MSQPTIIDNKVTFDDVYKDISHWRLHKNEYPNRGIPDLTWKKIFQLGAQGYSDNELKRLFSLNSHQYSVKRTQLCPKTATQSMVHQNNSDTKRSVARDNPQKNDDAIAFCEVVENKQPHNDDVPPLSTNQTKAAKKTQQAVSQLRSTDNSPEQFLDLTTIIVECIRPDGHRLKIHATTKSLDVVMQTFYHQGVIAE